MQLNLPIPHETPWKVQSGRPEDNNDKCYLHLSDVTKLCCSDSNKNRAMTPEGASGASAGTAPQKKTSIEEKEEKEEKENEEEEEEKEEEEEEKEKYITKLTIQQRSIWERKGKFSSPLRSLYRRLSSTGRKLTFN